MNHYKGITFNACPQVCPNCNGKELTNREIDHIGGDIVIHRKCISCNFTFSESYKFVNWEVTK
jgi:hypothetical protein